MSPFAPRIAPRLAASALVVLLGCSEAPGSDSPLAPAALAPRGGNPAAGVRAGPGARAWRIRAIVAVTPAPPPAGCLAYFDSIIEGHATHLGRFNGVGSTCVNGQVAPDPDPPFLPPGPAPYATATFTNPRWTLTAANGDQLWLETPEATLVLSIPGGSLRARGVQRIVGGTGRFEGATGMARVGAVNGDGDGPDDFRGTGWIRY